jgi:molybdopterin molybdotransferase
MMVRAGFNYRKKKGRREYVRVTLAALADGQYEAHKHPRDGAGVLSSLTETDGLIELADDVTEIYSGTPVAFIGYRDLT